MQLLGSKQIQSDGWMAIHFHLSELLEEYKSDYQIKIAVNLINDLLKTYEGLIYLFADYSIMVVCLRMEPIIKEKLTFQLRYLYMDDPLAYTDSGHENPKFCTVYDLKKDWQEFFSLCSHRMVMSTRRPHPPGTEPAPARLAAPERLAERAESLQTLTHTPSIEPVITTIVEAPVAIVQETQASRISAMEASLRVADIKATIRKQPVCAVLGDMKVRRVFDELYIHIAALRKLLKLEADFFTNRWLFKYITHILDERMIDLVRGNPSHYLENPISLNLNVETLLSARFAEFDASISSANKVAIVIEIPVADVFTDMKAFFLARDEVQKLGYRLCLDGLTTESFTSINREKLGLDLLKIQWNADLHADLKGDASKMLVDAVKVTGTNRLILCRCDNKSAIEYGQALGISLYQGRYLDGLLNPTSKVEN